MISSSFKNHLEHVLGCSINKSEPVSGGDISKAFCIYTSINRFFCKINQSDFALKMFLTEKLGLNNICQTNTINAPEVIDTGQFNGTSFIVMEFIEAKNPTSKEMEVLGHQLAQLHAFPINDSFGWNEHNFIGSLPQKNESHLDWSFFYVQERLLPQFKMALEKGLLNPGDIPTKKTLLKSIKKLMSEVKPSLLHGDLWSGNYLISKQGHPYLIDPAVYYGHHEVDIAMTQLFGGFSSTFYSAYEEIFSVQPYQKERQDIYQLYYLLVHLNLFGKSYYSSVMQLLKTYFS